MINITSYDSPDLDGTACAYAYAELLNTTTKQAIPILYGTPHQEARFVMQKFNISFPQNKESNKWILVDCSELEGLPTAVNPNDVSEIIDHRKAHQSHKFINAKAQIELVGAAATLIAEKFKEQHISPSKESAALLYSAIISNTINFKATLTTKRDQDAAAWLKNYVDIPTNYIKEMFQAKSSFDRPLIDICRGELALWSDTKLGIVQLEIVNAKEFLNSKKEELTTIIKKFKDENHLKYIFLTIIDLEKAYNTFLTIDEPTRVLLSKALTVAFEDNIATKEGILMRKQIVPKLLEKID